MLSFLRDKPFRTSILSEFFCYFAQNMFSVKRHNEKLKFKLKTLENKTQTFSV